jgi:uncharacterized glyoxalase superfamily protein PhnB
VHDVQRIVPYLYYADGSAALDFLCQAFGFEERLATRRGDGTLMHAELGFGGNTVMLGTPLDEDGQPQVPEPTERRHSGVLCYVDDVDAHCARARAAGARIASPPADQAYGARTYTAVDPEGHQWFFSTRREES